MACSGPGWRRLGYFGPEPAGQEGRKEVLFRKLLKGLRYVPRAIITDKLKSYSAAKAEVTPSVDHVRQKYQTTALRILISQPDCGSV
jgi:hypothetical protein